MTDYNQPCSDSLVITDSHSRIVAYIKNISEAGLVPSSTLYPSATLIPLTPIALYDTYTNLPSKNVSDAFTSTDVIGPYVVGKALGDGVSISDTIMKAFVIYLVECGRLPDTTLYPADDIYPEGGINISDVVGSGFFAALSDSCNIGDVISSFDVAKHAIESLGISDSNTKIISKYLEEFGLVPDVALYPADDLYPYSGIVITDVVGSGFSRWLSDSFNITDIDGINFGITKGLIEDISVFDIILFNICAYLEENTNILDEISKGEYKSLSDTFMIEDNIVKNITQLLSESMIIDDTVEVIVRTLVRATLRAIKSGGSSLRTL